MATQIYSQEPESVVQNKRSAPQETQASAAPGAALPLLQRQLGNRALRRLMETARGNGVTASPQGPAENLAPGDLGRLLPVLRQEYGLSEPNDPVEQEARAVARQVVQMQPVGDPGRGADAQPERAAWQAPTISRAPAPGQESHSAVALDLPTSDGQPLDQGVAAYMEPRFRYSFQDVRMHAGPQAADLSGLLGARAFTVGKDIYLGHGEYQPQTQAGKELIAHELTHVVQQGLANHLSGDWIGRVKAPEPTKTLTLNITQLEGSSRSTTLTDASTILENAANIKIATGTVQTLDKAESEALIGADLTLDEFTAEGSPTAEETALTAVNRTAGTITAYFVKALSHGSHGEAFIAKSFPTIPTSIAVKDGDSPFSAGKPVAHELGHILLDKGDHPSDVTFLMSYSNTGVGFDATDRATARGSSFVK